MTMPPAPVSPLPPVTEEDDFISLAPLWGLVRRYRRWLELSLFSALLLGSGLLAAAYVFFPKKIRADLEFTLTFPDASMGTYPNKLPFRPEDLLENSLLRRVYDGNGLSAFLKFEEFKSGLSLERSGNDLELLQKEFRARLDDRKLTLAEREKIEAQYEAQLKTIPPTTYRLNFVQSARSARLIPPARRTKVLEEILRVWSSDAVIQKKVLAFAARLPGEMTQPAQGLDPLVAMMELIERTRVLAEGLGEMARLPGGYQAALGDGSRLADLFLRLEVIQELRIPQVRSALLGNIADPAQASAVERVFRLQVRMREDRLRLAQEKLKSAVSTYRDYLASRFTGSLLKTRDVGGSGAAGGTQLQISDTFLTKLMELGRGNEDAQYRASLVEKIRAARLEVAAEDAALRETREIIEGLSKDAGALEKEKGTNPAKTKGPAGEVVENRKDFSALLLQGCRELNALIADSVKLRALITETYMNPQTSLYRITQPVLAEDTSVLTPRSSGLFLVGFVVLVLGISLVACWAHDQSIKPQD